MLSISISNADVFCTYPTESPSLCLGRSLAVAIVADGSPGRLIPAMLQGQGFQRGIFGQGREASARPVGIDQGQGLGAKVDGRNWRLCRTYTSRNQSRNCNCL